MSNPVAPLTGKLGGLDEGVCCILPNIGTGALMPGPHTLAVRAVRAASPERGAAQRGEWLHDA